MLLTKEGLSTFVNLDVHVCGSGLLCHLSVLRFVVLNVSKPRLSEFRLERVHESALHFSDRCADPSAEDATGYIFF